MGVKVAERVARVGGDVAVVEAKPGADVRSRMRSREVRRRERKPGSRADGFTLCVLTLAGKNTEPGEILVFVGIVPIRTANLR